MTITKLTDTCCNTTTRAPAQIRIALLKVTALFVVPSEFCNTAGM
jgi:hypothetical protein